MIRSKKKFVFLLSLLAVTICTPFCVNADDNMDVENAVIADTASVGKAANFINNEGKIENAIFYKDGRYLYSGCKAINDKEGLYYNDGTKDKFIGDYDTSNLRTFGSKYTVVSKDGDEFLVDLSSGEVLTDETLADKLNSISSTVKDNIDSTSRYGSIDGDVEIKELGNNKYMDPMYQYFAVPSSDSQGYNDTAFLFDGGELKTGLFGFTNEDGDYIDITKKANIYAYSSKLKSMCLIDEYNKLDEESGLEVKLTGQAKALCEDENYIYVMVGVSIEDTNSSSSLKGGTTVYAFIQKISKNAGEKYDDVYLPETVESYEVTSQYNLSDDPEPNNKIYNVAVLSSVKNAQYDRTPFNASCTVKDGDLYITEINKSKNKVRVNKIKLAKENVVYNEGGMKISGSMDIGYRSSAANEAGSFDAYVAELDGSSIEQDITECSNFSQVSISSMQLAMILAGFKTSPAVFPELPVGSVTYDDSGDIWILNNGNIMRYSEDGFETIYTCDSNMNKIKVYDKNNIMVWNEDKDIYAVIKDGQYKQDVKVEEDDDKEDDDKHETGTVTIDGVVYKLYEKHAEAVNYYGWADKLNLPQEITTGGKTYAVTAIADNAFDYCNTITEFVIPDSVKSIGKEAFRGSSALRKVTMGSGVKTIGENAFIYCTGLKTINIGEGVTTIAKSAFEYCESLENLTMGDNIKVIEKEAFKDCKSLITVSMGDSVDTIGEYAFWGCSSLKDIKLSNNLTSINNGLFKNCRSLTNITIPNSVTSVGVEAFGDCQSLKTLVFPSSVVSIGKNVIYNHNSLTKIVIPSNVTDIAVGAFQNNNSNEDTTFYVGNTAIKNALIRDGVIEKRIKFIGSGSSGSSSSHDKDKTEETTTPDVSQNPQQGTVTGGETSGTSTDKKEQYTPQWHKNNDGKWSYYDSLGEPIKEQWVLDKGNWYYLGSDGYMQIGWTKLNGTWYYLNNNGSMKTGWLKDNDQWYYLTNDGSMKIGWINTGDNWYYLSSDGSMLYNTSVDGYYLDENGAWVH